MEHPSNSIRKSAVFAVAWHLYDSLEDAKFPVQEVSEVEEWGRTQLIHNALRFPTEDLVEPVWEQQIARDCIGEALLDADCEWMGTHLKPLIIEFLITADDIIDVFKHFL